MLSLLILSDRTCKELWSCNCSLCYSNFYFTIPAIIFVQLIAPSAALIFTWQNQQKCLFKQLLSSAISILLCWDEQDFFQVNALSPILILPDRASNNLCSCNYSLPSLLTFAWWRGLKFSPKTTLAILFVMIFYEVLA